jgi:hypothetical protein
MTIELLLRTVILLDQVIQLLLIDLVTVKITPRRLYIKLVLQTLKKRNYYPPTLF